MLLPGKELYIKDKPVLCLKCNWEGVGVELSTRLLQKPGMEFLLYVYACPVCNSFDLARKAKVLPFPWRDQQRKQA
jgi:hypothetical protein